MKNLQDLKVKKNVSNLAQKRFLRPIPNPLRAVGLNFGLLDSCCCGSTRERGGPRKQCMFMCICVPMYVHVSQATVLAATFKGTEEHYHSLWHTSSQLVRESPQPRWPPLKPQGDQLFSGPREAKVINTAASPVR